MNRRAFLASAAACGLGAVSCQRTQSTGEVKGRADRKVAPAFALQDADGRTANLADYRGKVVVLNFWATWCTPCKIEIPWFVNFERQYKDRGFAVLGVAMDNEGWDVVRPFLAESGINYRVLMTDEKTRELYGGIEEVPTTYLIDRDGRIARTHLGLVSRDIYEKDIKTLLAQPAAS